MQLVDRREAPRYRVLKGAQIYCIDGSVLMCSVRNLSYKGARLKLDVAVEVPDRFSLEIVGESARQCRVSWQANREIGVVFE
jgi:hypothetical protein